MTSKYLYTSDVYAHYKGGVYRFLATGLESTNGRERKPVVIYISLLTGEINVRDEDEFHEVVDWFDGSRAPRFRPVS